MCRVVMIWIRSGLALVLVSFALQAGNQQKRGNLLEFPGRPPGKLVDVGGHRLHINCTGKGTPAVVMEAGAGETSRLIGA